MHVVLAGSAISITKSVPLACVAYCQTQSALPRHEARSRKPGDAREDIGDLPLVSELPRPHNAGWALALMALSLDIARATASECRVVQAISWPRPILAVSS